MKKSHEEEPRRRATKKSRRGFKIERLNHREYGEHRGKPRTRRSSQKNTKKARDTTETIGTVRAERSAEGAKSKPLAGLTLPSPPCGYAQSERKGQVANNRLLCLMSFAFFVSFVSFSRSSCRCSCFQGLCVRVSGRLGADRVANCYSCLR